MLRVMDQRQGKEQLLSSYLDPLLLSTHLHHVGLGQYGGRKSLALTIPNPHSREVRSLHLLGKEHTGRETVRLARTRFYFLFPLRQSVLADYPLGVLNLSLC